MHNISQEFKELKSLLIEIKQLKQSGIDDSDSRSMTFMFSGFGVVGVTPLLIWLFPPALIAAIPLATLFFMDASQKAADKRFGVSKEQRNKFNDLLSRLNEQLVVISKFSTIVHKINYKDERVAQTFKSFISHYLSAKTYGLFSSILPNKISIKDDKSPGIYAAAGTVQIDLLSSFESFANRPLKLFEKRPPKATALDASRNCIDLIEEYNISIMDMLEINYITKDGVLAFVKRGYRFSETDYEILEKMLKEKSINKGFLSDLKSNSTEINNFDTLIPPLDATSARSLDNLPLPKVSFDDNLQTAPSFKSTQTYALPVITGLDAQSAGITSKSLELLHNYKNTPQEKILSTLLQQDPAIYEKYGQLVTKINLIKELPLSLEDKTELINIENKVLPEVLQIYIYSQNVIEKEKVKDFLINSIDNITLSIESVSARFSEQLTNQADALSRYTHIKTMSMGGKK